MMKIILGLMSLLLVTAKPERVIMSGWLSAYGHSPTVGTIEYRKSVGDLPQDITKYDGLIAVKDCGLVGKDATLYTASGKFHVKVFDCADRSGSDGTVSWMESNSIVAEVGYFLWDSYPEIVGAKAKVSIP